MASVRKNRIYGKLLYIILRLLKATIRYHMFKARNYKDGGTYIYACWHQNLFVPTVYLDKIEVDKMVALVSPSSDGEILSTVLSKFGYEIVRGSSNDKNIRSLLSLIKLLKKGYSMGTPVDGPKGPIYEVKPGLVYLSQKTGIPLVPVGVAYSKYWLFEKAWDKFKLPKPFATTIITLLDPIYIPSDMSIEQGCELVKVQINIANEKAEKIL